jgi:hypothetical protein
MRFVQSGEGWQLVDDQSRVLATLRSEVEVLALKQFCVHFVANSATVPEHFVVVLRGQRHVVTPLGGPGENLTLLITGPEGLRVTVETGLRLVNDT